VVVIFGAIHTPIEIGAAVLSSHAAWAEPTGESAVREDVGRRLSEKTNVFITDDRFHRHEHAVEVELPLIQSAFPQASILPVEVPVVEEAGEIGREVARQAKNAGLEAVFLASSDLTHYGPSYRFAPAGVGINGLNWAKENDRRLIDLVLQRAIERIVPEVRKNYNACGGGAIAAMLAACDELGADSSELLKHASSFETLAKVAPQQPADAVGYAGVVIG
jgi:AmmeMemoRadiSam system protein B